MIIVIWLTIFLLICSLIDLVERSVYTMFCLTNGLIICIMQFLLHKNTFLNCLLGSFIGVAFLFVSLTSKEAIGRGDALVIGIVGVALGLQETIEVLLWSFLLILIISMVGVVRKAISLKTRLPLIPFIFIGTIIVLGIRGG